MIKKEGLSDYKWPTRF